MNADDRARVVGETESVCPVCLKRIPAQRILVGDDVTLSKTCPEHGHFQTVIWRGAGSYLDWARPKPPVLPERPFTTSVKGCPFDCGLCPQHHQQPCCVLLEVTNRCDLCCPVCFASAGDAPEPDPDLLLIRGWYERLLQAGGPFNIQLSGGEPTLRDDLPDIIRMGRSLGFTFFQVNTNGLRLGRDPEYVEALKQAGLSAVFLQFDGLDDEIYRKIRGRALLEQKLAAIQVCAEHGLGVVLVPTLVPGVNTGSIGEIVNFAIQNHPRVRSVHFQPISYFGRCPAPLDDSARITIPEIIAAIDAQTGGRLPASAFKPSAAENAYCSFHGSFVIMPDGSLKPVTQRSTAACCAQPQRYAPGASQRAREFVARSWTVHSEPEQIESEGPSLGGWDSFLARAHTHLFSITGMAFQDAWTLDLERLRECYINTVSADGRVIPFCAYNLTASDGRSLYRTNGKRV
jgi:uncharacterized radical SAM superfamily Fe-S cluster-containing enzyme